MERLRQYRAALSEHMQAALTTRETHALSECIQEVAQALEADDEKVRLGRG